jgi:hypothetical protein
MAKEPNDLSTILNRTRQLISEGKITEALELLQEVGKRIDIMETENLKMQEEFLWERAMHHLDFSNKLTNRDQYIAYATLAHEYWRDYINWYERLFPENRAKLPKSNIRIKMATAHLGNCIIRMGEPRRLFQEYSEISNVDYLGVDAIDLWKSWLYACPDMRPVQSSERTIELRRKKICDESCKEDWISYADIVDQWAKVENLNANARLQRLREVNQIKETAKRCQY